MSTRADERAADLRSPFRERVLAAREQAQARAVAREAKRDRLADPAARARDDDVPVSTARSLVSRKPTAIRGRTRISGAPQRAILRP